MEVTFRVSPIAKLTIQLENKRRGLVKVKGKRSVLEANVEELLMFFGPVAGIKAATPPAQHTDNAQPVVRLSARERLAGAKGPPTFQ